MCVVPQISCINKRLVNCDIWIISEQPPASIAFIAEALRDEDLSVRRACGISLERIGEAAAPQADAIAQALSDEDVEVRRSSARALGRVGRACVPHSGVMLNLAKSGSITRSI